MRYFYINFVFSHPEGWMPGCRHAIRLQFFRFLRNSIHLEGEGIE